MTNSPNSIGVRHWARARLLANLWRECDDANHDARHPAVPAWLAVLRSWRLSPVLPLF